jgi:hypothetical protein
MDIVSMTIAGGWIAAGLLTIGLAIPLLQGKIGRNALYGARFRKSFQSDDAWFAINRYGAKRMILWALPMILVGITTLTIPLQSRPVFALLLGLAPLVFVLIPALDTWNFARRYTENGSSVVR